LNTAREEQARAYFLPIPYNEKHFNSDSGGRQSKTRPPGVGELLAQAARQGNLQSVLVPPVKASNPGIFS
jgi:hypothetical protein